MLINITSRRGRRKINKSLLWGLLLLVPSLYTAFLMAREARLSNIVYGRYSVTECFKDQPGQLVVSQTPLSYTWHGRRIVLSDDFEKGSFTPDDKREREVIIVQAADDDGRIVLPAPIPAGMTELEWLHSHLHYPDALSLTDEQ